MIENGLRDMSWVIIIAVKNVTKLNNKKLNLENILTILTHFKLMVTILLKLCSVVLEFMKICSCSEAMAQSGKSSTFLTKNCFRHVSKLHRLKQANSLSQLANN